jgi:nucleoside-diphosphate-sugar epimerase
MRVLVTGAAGFIGRHLVQALLERGRLRDAGGRDAAIEEVVLADVVAARVPPGPAAPRITAAQGDLGDAGFLARLFAEDFDTVFHLAATLTGEAEADVAGGLAVNVEALLALLARCRAQARPPRLVFASSIAAFGGALPEVVEDDTPRRPRTSYGTHKVVAELLLADHARHGLVDARALRLPIVLIRPGAPNAAVSDRVAAILREPLLGRDVACPLEPDTTIPVASARRVALALRAVHDLPADAIGPDRAMNLPALTVSVAEMVAALDRHAATRRLGRLSWAPDAALQAVVEGWPRRFDSATARRHGIAADAGLGEIIETFLRDQPQT